MEGIKVPCKISENSKIARGIFSGAHPLELGPQGIPEALRAAQGDLESTFVRSKTMPGPQKMENLENSIFFFKMIFKVIISCSCDHHHMMMI